MGFEFTELNLSRGIFEGNKASANTKTCYNSGSLFILQEGECWLLLVLSPSMSNSHSLGWQQHPRHRIKVNKTHFFSLFLFFLKEGIIIQPVKSAVTPGPIIASPRLAVSAQVSVHKLLSQRGAWPNVNTFLKVSIQWFVFQQLMKKVLLSLTTLDKDQS